MLLCANLPLVISHLTLPSCHSAHCNSFVDARFCLPRGRSNKTSIVKSHFKQRALSKAVFGSAVDISIAVRGTKKKKKKRNRSHEGPWWWFGSLQPVLIINAIQKYQHLRREFNLKLLFILARELDKCPVMIGSGARWKWQQPLRQSSSFSSRPANVLICSLSASPGALPHTVTATHAHTIMRTHTLTHSLQSFHKFLLFSPDSRSRGRKEQGCFGYFYFHIRQLIVNANTGYSYFILSIICKYILFLTFPLSGGLGSYTSTWKAPFWKYFLWE